MGSTKSDGEVETLEENTMGTVRKVLPDDLSKVFELVDGENFLLPAEKYHGLYQAYPECFYLLEKEDGEIIGTVSFTKVLPNVYCLGYLVIKKGHRMKGLGKYLVLRAMSGLEYKACIVSIIPGSGNFYRSCGFNRSDVLQDHYIQMVTFQPDRLISKLKAAEPEFQTVTVQQYTSSDFQDLVDFDRKSRCHDNNTAFLSALTGFSTIIVARYTANNQIAGFAASIHTTSETKDKYIALEGLYADSDAIALLLLRDTLSQHPDTSKVKLHTLGSRPFLRDIAEASATFVTYRFHQGVHVPPVPTDPVYVPCDCDFTH